MDISIKPGKYVVAVSGGVDSMVLLDLLARETTLDLPKTTHSQTTSGPAKTVLSERDVPVGTSKEEKQFAAGQMLFGGEGVLRKSSKCQFIVAHFDHGIRADSAVDRKLVAKAAKKYGLPFVYARGKLGEGTSEALAREARYKFLYGVKREQAAKAVITAHHQDDMLETAIMNLLRGTGRLGLSSLKSRPGLLRPLLEWGKKDIYRYAEEHRLVWREDTTNQNDKLLRNYIRHNILPKFAAAGQASLLEIIRRAGKINQKIDALLDIDLDSQPQKDELNRGWYLALPYAVAREMMAAWLRRNGILHFDRHMIERLVVAAKTASPGKLADVDSRHTLEFTPDKVRLKNR